MPSGEELYQDGSDWHCVEYLNGEMVDDAGCCSSHSGLAASGIDPVGSIAVLNIGSFRTWSREVLTFDSSAGSFTYAQVPSDQWKYKHHVYFLTQKLELLDTPGEWFFDDDSSGNTIYYMPRAGGDPNDLDIRVKTKAYGVTCADNDDIKVEGIDFFAAAFSLDDCDGAQVRNSTLLYPSTSKRSLGVAGEDQDNRYVSRMDDCVGCLIDTCEFLYTDGAAIEAHGGTSSSVGNQVNNSYFYYIDWSGSDQISLMTTIAMSGTSNLFTNNTMHKTGTSATIRIGDAPQVMFNEIYDTAHLQSDGTIIQMMQGEQEGAEIAYNWVHDSPKYGIRMDGPFGGTNSGRNASVHHNVVWNINGGIIAKGDYHNVSHNTAFDSPSDSSGRNDIVVLYDDTGGNENSTVQYNAADRMAGHRTDTLQQSPFPQNDDISDNWNGFDDDNSGETVTSQLADLGAYDFRPVVGSEIDALQAGAYLSSQAATAPSDPANYDPSTYYWNPGIKRDASSPWARSTYTLPCTGGSYYDGTSCQDSSAGHYVDGWGQTSQTACAAGTYQPSTGQTTCLDADAGYNVPTSGQSAQTACAAGTYQPSTGQTTCLDADAGYYVPTSGQSAQTACTTGTYQPSTGQTTCLDADAGFYVTSTASTSQTACAPGAYQPSTGQTTCLDADAGSYVPGYMEVEQYECSVGTYQPSTGQASCLDADSGHYVGSTGQSAQTACSAGTYNPDTGQTSCLDADSGHYVDSTGQSAQTACSAGTYNPDTGSSDASACLDADAGHYVDSTGQSAQTACSAGTYNPDTGSSDASDCLDADAGHYVGSTGQSAQMACAAGTYQPSTAQSSCLDADAGHYALGTTYPQFKEVDLGYLQTCSVLENGSVYCWGNNGYGQIGDGSTTSRDVPTLTGPFASGTTATNVSTGYGHSCAILSDGSVACWGLNDRGQLGDGTTTDRLTPTQTLSLGTGRTAVSISASGMHTCAILDDGSVACWGRNTNGELGDGTTIDRTAPTQTDSLGIGRTAVYIASGWDHTCAILDDGSVACWGDNLYGQLGDGTVSDRTTPTQTSSLGLGRTAVQISAGEEHTCAVLDDGSVVCWGHNDYGKLGDGTDTHRSTPTQTASLGAGRTATQVSTDWHHTCAVLDNGNLSCWGLNGDGQLGDGTTNNRNTPSGNVISGLGRAAVLVSVDTYHTCVLLQDGNASCWGLNAIHGNVGDGTSTNRISPVLVETSEMLELSKAQLACPWERTTRTQGPPRPPASTPTRATMPLPVANRHRPPARLAPTSPQPVNHPASTRSQGTTSPPPASRPRRHVPRAPTSPPPARPVAKTHPPDTMCRPTVCRPRPPAPLAPTTPTPAPPAPPPASTPTQATTSRIPASRPRPPAPLAPTTPTPAPPAPPPASTPTQATTSRIPASRPRPPAPRGPTSPPPARPRGRVSRPLCRQHRCDRSDRLRRWHLQPRHRLIRGL